MINGLSAIFSDLGKAGFVFDMPYKSNKAKKTKIMPLDDFDPLGYFEKKKLFNNEKKKSKFYDLLRDKVHYSMEHFKQIEPRVKKIIDFQSIYVND